MVSSTSCFLIRNRFLSLVKYLLNTLNFTVCHKCTFADDTRTNTTTWILNIHPDTHKWSAPPLARDGSPYVVSHSAVVSLCSAELSHFLGKDGLRHRLRTLCNCEHSVFTRQCSTYSASLCLTCNTGLSNASCVQSAIRHSLFVAKESVLVPLAHVLGKYFASRWPTA